MNLDFIKEHIEYLNSSNRTDIFEHVGLWHYLRECKTLGYNLPRRVGKTKFIAENARAGDLVICYNEAMKKHFWDNYQVRAITLQSLLEPDKWRGLPLKREFPSKIWLDEIPMKFIEDVIRATGQSKNQTYIWLGT